MVAGAYSPAAVAVVPCAISQSEVCKQGETPAGVALADCVVKLTLLKTCLFVWTRVFHRHGTFADSVSQTARQLLVAVHVNVS